MYILFYHGQQPPVGQGLLIVEASRSHSDTPHSVGLLWTGDQPYAETSTRQHTTPTTDFHAPCGIRTHNPSKRAAADLRLRPGSHWDRLDYLLKTRILMNSWHPLGVGVTCTSMWIDFPEELLTNRTVFTKTQCTVLFPSLEANGFSSCQGISIPLTRDPISIVSQLNALRYFRIHLNPLSAAVWSLQSLSFSSRSCN